MRGTKSLAFVAIAVALVAARLLLRNNAAPDREQSEVAVQATQSPNPGPISSEDEAAQSAPTTTVVPARAVAETPRQSTLAELMRFSESYRNNTFLVAIHDAGFICQVVTEAMPVGVPTVGWQVRCPRELGYSIVVNDEGALKIAPALSAFDGVAPNKVTLPPPVDLPPRE